MFESFVLTNIRKENEIINTATEFSRESILKSGLSDFSKNYLIYDFPEKTDKSEFLLRIEKSNKLFLNYVIRPKWTLLAFLFGNFESRPPNEIINRLSLFPFYKFYVDAISDFIKDNSQIFVTKHEITEIIEETNKVIYDKLTVDISGIKIKNFFLQIFNLKYEAGSNNNIISNNNIYNLESTIPYSFLKIFLEDKSYPDLIKKFKVIGDLSEESEISLKDIIKILTGKYNSVNKSVEESLEESVKQIEESGEKCIETDSDEIIISDVKKDASGKTITGIPSVTKEIFILDKDEKIVQEKIKQGKIKQGNIKQENIKQEEMKPGEAPEKIYSEGLIKANKEAEAKTKKEENNNLPEAEQKRNQILKDLFDKKHFQKILNKVYKLDLISSEKSFDKLSAYKTWKEATYHLKEIFRNNRVDIYNKDVMKFVNVLNDYFKQKE